MVFIFLRDASLTHGNTSDVIKEAIEVTRNNRINVESLKSLQQVCSQNITLKPLFENNSHKI